MLIVGDKLRNMIINVCCIHGSLSCQHVSAASALWMTYSWDKNECKLNHNLPECMWESFPVPEERPGIQAVRNSVLHTIILASCCRVGDVEVFVNELH